MNYARVLSALCTTFLHFFSNSLLMEEETKAANNLFNVEFVTLPYNESDPEIVVSEEEIKDYYNAHKNLFSDIAETRNIEYVVVEYDIEDEDTVYEQVDSVFNNINGVESLIKVAVDNGYSHNAETVPMLKNTWMYILRLILTRLEKTSCR